MASGAARDETAPARRRPGLPGSRRPRRRGARGSGHSLLAPTDVRATYPGPPVASPATLRSQAPRGRSGPRSRRAELQDARFRESDGSGRIGDVTQVGVCGLVVVEGQHDEAETAATCEESGTFLLPSFDTCTGAGARRVWQVTLAAGATGQLAMPGAGPVRDGHRSGRGGPAGRAVWLAAGSA